LATRTADIKIFKYKADSRTDWYLLKFLAPAAGGVGPVSTMSLIESIATYRSRDQLSFSKTGFFLFMATIANAREAEKNIYLICACTRYFLRQAAF
jgi:hypothetical protein